MSNSSLISQIEAVLSSVRAGRSSGKSLADAMRGNGRALEGMPYPIVREMESLALDLEVASWDDEESPLPGMKVVLDQVDDWLDKLPRSTPL